MNMAKIFRGSFKDAPIRMRDADALKRMHIATYHAGDGDYSAQREENGDLRIFTTWKPGETRVFPKENVNDRRRQRDADLAQRTAVAHFPGPDIKAAREGVDEDETLRIYREVVKNGLPAKEEIGKFLGKAFIAESNEKGLIIFHYGGQAIPKSAIGDRSPMTADKLQRKIVQHREGRNDR
jgi:hypothetical protein